MMKHIVFKTLNAPAKVGGFYQSIENNLGYFLVIKLLFILLISCTAFSAKAAIIGCDRRNPMAHVLTYEGGVGAAQYAKDKNVEPNITDFVYITKTVFPQCFENGYKGTITFDLNSPGGSVDTGMKIANFIKSKNEEMDKRGYGKAIRTRISEGNYCISACTFIFITGFDRKIEKHASFEPHGFSAYSGTRVDQAIDIAFNQATEDTEGLKFASEEEKDKYLQKQFVSLASKSIAYGRLSFLLSTFAKLNAVDQRFDWMPQPSRSIDHTLEKFIRGFINLRPEQQQLIAKLDSLIHLTVTELERKAALTAFAPFIGEQAEINVAMVTGNESTYENQLLNHSLKLINEFLVASKAGEPLTDLEMLRPAIATEIQVVVVSTMNSVNHDFLPLFKRTTIDWPGLVKLMFSTSIMYTRPLTHEELCSLTIIDADCY